MCWTCKGFACRYACPPWGRLSDCVAGPDLLTGFLGRCLRNLQGHYHPGNTEQRNFSLPSPLGGRGSVSLKHVLFMLAVLSRHEPQDGFLTVIPRIIHPQWGGRWVCSPGMFCLLQGTQACLAGEKGNPLSQKEAKGWKLG